MPTTPELSETTMLVGRAIVCDQAGRILLGQRQSAPMTRNDPDHWEHFGGRTEASKGDVTTVDTAIRELQEESGFLAVPDRRYAYPSLLVDRPLRPMLGEPAPVGTYRAIGHRLTIIGGVQLEELPEHQAIGWFWLEQAKQLLLTEPTRNSLGELAADSRAHATQLIASAR
jgi:8-oxo-dGTP pyrophosphatase MutT (NUDIX family)